MEKTIFEQAVDNASSIIAEQKALDWSPKVKASEVTVKEMIGTDDGSREFIEKTTYDLYSGREAVPLVYKQLYTTINDRNLPRTLTEEEFGPVQVVFLEKFEGGEVRFGSLGPGTSKAVTLHTYAAGIEISEDMLEWNQTWRMSEVSVAFGESYNKLLNNMHLTPIIGGTYVTTGGSLAAQKVAQEDTLIAQLIAYDTDLPTTLRNAMQVLPRGTKLLINSADRYVLEDAIASSMYADTSPSVVKRRLSSGDLIEYDGETVTVGGKEYTYTGVASGFVYFMVPKKMFKEYVKHGLRIDSGDGDLSRLIVTQMVGRSRRGVMTSLGNKQGAVKIDIAA